MNLCRCSKRSHQKTVLINYGPFMSFFISRFYHFFSPFSNSSKHHNIHITLQAYIRTINRPIKQQETEKAKQWNVLNKIEGKNIPKCTRLTAITLLTYLHITLRSSLGSQFQNKVSLTSLCALNLQTTHHSKKALTQLDLLLEWLLIIHIHTLFTCKLNCIVSA